jgi:hypothetical protein
VLLVVVVIGSLSNSSGDRYPRVECRLVRKRPAQLARPDAEPRRSPSRTGARGASDARAFAGDDCRRVQFALERMPNEVRQGALLITSAIYAPYQFFTRPHYCSPAGPGGSS